MDRLNFSMDLQSVFPLVDIARSGVEFLSKPVVVCYNDINTSVTVNYHFNVQELMAHICTSPTLFSKYVWDFCSDYNLDLSLKQFINYESTYEDLHNLITTHTEEVQEFALELKSRLPKKLNSKDEQIVKDGIEPRFFAESIIVTSPVSVGNSIIPVYGDFLDRFELDIVSALGNKMTLIYNRFEKDFNTFGFSLALDNLRKSLLKIVPKYQQQEKTDYILQINSVALITNKCIYQYYLKMFRLWGI